MEIDTLTDAEIVTAGAYVVWRGRYVFMVGFPGGVTDRLGVVRLGGHREKGEDAWSCAAREVLEESGLSIRPLTPPATYWIGPGQDEHSMVAARWRGDTPWHGDGPGTAAPLLVGWRPDLDHATARQLSLTYLVEAMGTPRPAAETQGLLLLRPDHVRAIAQHTLTLGELLDRGAEVLFRAPLPTHLPLEPLTQPRVLALLLDRHPQLASC